MSGMVSRDSRPPSTARGRGRVGPIVRPGLSCNSCRTPMATNGFLCKCDHLFCEKCAEKYFSESCICPICNTRLPGDGLHPVTVTNPPEDPSAPKVSSMQALFAKDKTGSSQLFFDGMLRTLLGKIDNLRSETSFLFKQISRDTIYHARNNGMANARFQKLRQEFENMKHAKKSSEAQASAVVEEMRQKEIGQDQKINELRAQLEEKEHLLKQFRMNCGKALRSPRGSSDNRSIEGRRDYLPPLRDRRFEPPSQGLLSQQREQKPTLLVQAEQRLPDFRSESYDNYSVGSDGGRYHLRQPQRSPVTTGGLRNNLHSTDYQFSSGGRQNKRRRLSVSAQSVSSRTQGYEGYQTQLPLPLGSTYSGSNNWRNSL